MEIEIGRGKKARRAYGFDDIAIVPSRRTRDPDDVDISWTLGPYRFELPLLASAMDGVVSPETARIIGKLGGLAVLNLEGIWTRYEDADAQLERIAQLPEGGRDARDAGDLPGAVKPELIRQRIEEIKEEPGVVVAASLTPQRVAPLLRARARRRPRHPRHPGHGRLGRARLGEDDAAEPQGVHRARSRSRSSPAAAPPTRRACTSCAPAPPACSSASAPARRARRAACSGSACRRRRRSPTSPARARRTCSRPGSTSRSSPTAACAPAATSPRRSPAGPTP